MAFYVGGVIVGGSVPFFNSGVVGALAIVKNVNNTVVANEVDPVKIGVNTTNLKFTTCNNSDQARPSGTWKFLGGAAVQGDGALWQRIS